MKFTQANQILANEVTRKGSSAPQDKKTLVQKALEFVFEAVKLLDEVIDLSGPQKKAFLMKKLEQLLDTWLPAIPMPWWMLPFKSFIISRLKVEILAIADVAIEAFIEQIRKLEGK